MFYDVVVVGAGPAGSTAALAIKKKLPNLSVLLVDKSSFPRDKVCGDGIGPGSLLIAEQLGIYDRLFEGEQLIEECVLFGSDNGPLVTPIPKVSDAPQCGAVVRRVLFDDRLRSEALAVGVESKTARFVSTEQKDSMRSVIVESEGETQTIETRLLIGADGASSRIRKALNQKPNSDKKRAIAIRCYVDDLRSPQDLKNLLLFEFNEQLTPGYGWLFPLVNNAANIGVGMAVHEFKARRLDLKDLLNQYLETLRARGFIFGETTDVATYMLPHGAHRPKLAHDQAVLIGDSASMINPLTGEGIFYGMAAGSMLADSLTEELSRRELRTFARSFNKRFRWHYMNNYLALRSLASWKQTQRAFRRLEADPEALRVAVNLMFGDGHLKPRTALRFARRAIFN